MKPPKIYKAPKDNILEASHKHKTKVLHESSQLVLLYYTDCFNISYIEFQKIINKLLIKVINTMLIKVINKLWIKFINTMLISHLPGKFQGFTFRRIIFDGGNGC